MADTTIPVQNPAVSDSLLDAESLTVSALTVKRERYQIAGASALEIARVVATNPAATDYGLAVRTIGSLADNTAFVDGTTSVRAAGFVFDDVAGTALTENDIAAARIDSKRAQMVTLEDATTRGTKARILTTAPALADAGIVVRPVIALDNGAFTDATTPVLPVGFIFDEVAGTALTENDVAAARVDSKRAQIGVIEDATTRGQRAAVTAAGALQVVTSPTEASVLTSAARTTTQTQADQTNLTARGIVVVLDVTSAGTGDITLKIEGKDPVSGKYVTLLAGTNVTSISTNVYTIQPAGPVAANVSANAQLWRTWRVVVTANNANSVTYSVGAILLP